MKKVYIFSLIIILSLFSLGAVYHGSLIGSKVIFPANFLASFFSPWATTKFAGWEQGIPSKPIGTDQIRFFYPVRKVVSNQLKMGETPLWNPYIFSGAPLLANYQSAIFSPLSFLMLIFEQMRAWQIETVAGPVMATFFMFLFLKSLGAGNKGGFIGAYAFGFSGFILSWSSEAMAVAQTAVWLPLIFYGIEQYIKTRKAVFWITTTLAIAFSFLSGYFQISFYCLALASLYIIFRVVAIHGARKEKLLVLISTLLSVLMGISLSAIQLFPSAEAFFLSPRPTTQIETVFKTYLLPISHLLRLIAPDINGNTASYNYFAPGSYNETALYIGVVPLVFALIAVFLKRNFLTKFMGVGAILSFALTTNNFLTRFILKLPIPLIPTFQPSRILVLTTFCLAVLAGIGFSHWEKKPGRTIFIVLWLLVAVLIAGEACYFLFYPHSLALVSLRNAILPLGLLMGTIFTVRFGPPRITPIILIGLTMLGQIYFLNKYSMQGERRFVYPESPVFSFIKEREKDFSRHLTFGQSIKENASMMFEIYSPEGFDPIYPARYGQLAKAASLDGKLSKEVTSRIEVTISEIGNKETLTDNARRLRLMSLLGVKTVLYYPKPDVPRTYKDIFEEEFFGNVASFSGWTALNYKNSYPRAFLVGEVITVKNQQNQLDKMFDPKIDLRKTAIISDNFPHKLDPQDSEDQANIVSYEPNEVLVKTRSLGPKMLFLSDNYYPGWKAMVDGKESPIYLANFSFRGVFVPRGEHLVKFTYKPTSFLLGGAVTLGTFGVLILFCCGKFLLNRWRPEQGLQI
jgi:hypothetical protein